MSKPAKNPSIKEGQNFDVEAIAGKVREALSGNVTIEEIITNMISINNAQRQKVGEKFNDDDLIKGLKSKFPGPAGDLVIALAMSPPELHAVAIHEAISGDKIDEASLLDVFCSAEGSQLEAIAKSYQEMFKVSLEEAVLKASGPVKDIVAVLLKGNWEDTPADPQRAADDAKALQAASGNAGDELLLKIIAEGSEAQLEATLGEFCKLTGKSIPELIKTEVSADLQEPLLAVLQSIENPAEFFAARLNSSLSDVGTLVYILVSRSEIDLKSIADAFQKLAGKSLEDALAGISAPEGASKLLAAIVKGN